MDTLEEKLKSLRNFKSQSVVYQEAQLFGARIDYSTALKNFSEDPRSVLMRLVFFLGSGSELPIARDRQQWIKSELIKYDRSGDPESREYFVKLLGIAWQINYRYDYVPKWRKMYENTPIIGADRPTRRLTTQEDLNTLSEEDAQELIRSVPPYLKKFMPPRAPF